jgi:uncharacterized membrane protein
MSTELNSADTKSKSAGVVIIPLLASLVALVGLFDSIYLTIHHYTDEPVPCSISGGCEVVLTSSYATFYGVPIALFGALAYFIAFSLALLAGFGNRAVWTLFGIQATIMALVSAYLLYVQGFVLEHFCQYCLLSALSSVTLFILFIVSKLFRAKHDS